MQRATSPQKKARAELRLVENEPRQALAYSGEIPSLFGFRALCAMLVVVAHSSQMRLETHYASFFHQYLPYIPAFFAVRVFFIVSGFIITLKLLREERREDRISLKNFYIGRAFRLFPAALVFLALVPLFGMNEGERNPMQGWWTALTYTQAIAQDFFEPAWAWQHFWSLSVEEVFYLVWPIAFAFLNERKRTAALFGTILLVPLIRVACQVFGRFPGFTIVQHLDVIAIGCLTAILFFKYEDQLRPIFENHRRKIVISSASLILLVIYSSATLRWAAVRVPFGFSLEALAVSAILLSVTLSDKGSLFRFLNWKPLVTVGVMSYSLYIWQQAFTSTALSLVEGAQVGWWRSFPLNLPMIALATYLSYRFVEKPFQKWGKRLTSKHD